ncbi:MAG: SDR family NAD(P)-dependent oxidoreductase [Methylococcales bacterium]|nr:SDR family NAD(P)-dependent oxidoreductase [Methylococcales bacterium]
MTERSALVLGVGPVKGLGAALAQRFAREGLNVVIAGRSPAKLEQVAELIDGQGGVAVPVVADATEPAQMTALAKVLTERCPPLTLAALTVDRNQPAPFLDTDVALYTDLWRQNSLAAFLFAQTVIPLMLAQGQGTLLFTGATASLRAKPPFTAFASAKAGVRALAQGLAREFGPKGLHIVHCIIDGVIDGDRARQQFPDFVAGKGEDGLLDPEAIAETYWQLHQQPANAWSHELDLRPFKESF